MSTACGTWEGCALATELFTGINHLHMTCVCVCVAVWQCACVCVRVHVHVCVCVCVCVCQHIYALQDMCTQYRNRPGLLNLSHWFGTDCWLRTTDTSHSGTHLCVMWLRPAALSAACMINCNTVHCVGTCCVQNGYIHCVCMCVCVCQHMHCKTRVYTLQERARTVTFVLHWFGTDCWLQTTNIFQHSSSCDVVKSHSYVWTLAVCVCVCVLACQHMPCKTRM